MGELFKASLFPYEELQKRVLEGGDVNGDNATPHPVTSVNDLTGDVVLTPAIIGAEPLGAAKSVVTQHNANNKAHPDIRNLIANVPGQTDSKITEHNSSRASHSDIRELIADIKAVVDEFFAEGADNDQNLDRLVEIVTLINSNKSVIDTLATNKVNVADIINNLTTNSTNKPLSAAQGVALKALIDALGTNKLDTTALTTAINTALAQAKASGEFDGADGSNGKDGTSVTITNIQESTADGGSSVVTFSNGQKLTIKNAKTPIKGIDYFTEADKTAIITAVLEAIGTPIYGLLDENNHFSLTGNIPDGSYTFGFVMEDGSEVPVGSLVLDTAVYYSVTNSLANCTTTNSTTKVVEGKPYSANISANPGYELSSVTVTMGGSPVSVSGGVINIASVTGNIVITAVAEEAVVAPSYTNQIPLSINADGTPFVGTNGEKGYKTGFRLSLSSGDEKEQDGTEVTGFIPATKNSVLRIKDIAYLGDSTRGVVGYDANFAKLTIANGAPLISVFETYGGVDEGNGVRRSSRLGSYANFDSDNLKYIRICSTDINENSILTVDEEIV